MSELIRVLCVLATLNRGGTESVVMNLYRHINREKVQFDFIKHDTRVGDYEEEVVKLGGRVFTCPKYKAYNHMAYEAWWHRHFRMHPEHKIVHGHYFTLAAVYFRLAHRYKRVTIGHSHAAGMVIGNPKDLLVKAYCSQVARHCDYRLACGRDAGEWLYGDKPFAVVNNAIDTDAYRFSESIRATMRARLTLDDRLVIGNVGNFTIPKNHSFMIELFSELKNEVPSAVLMLVGDGPRRAEFEERAMRLGLADSVLFMGKRDDVPDLLQVMDVFFMPSLSEGLPVAMIEAQASGLPVVCSDIVTTEAKVTERVSFVSLDAPNAEWIRAIRSAAKIKAERSSAVQSVIDAGYDIRAVSYQMQDLYTRIECGHDERGSQQ